MKRYAVFAGASIILPVDGMISSGSLMPLMKWLPRCRLT